MITLTVLFTVLFKYSSKLLKLRSQIPIFPGRYYNSVKANRDDQVCERDKDIGKVFSVF
jgi:hypothetical protein